MSQPYFTVNIPLDGLAVEDIPGMLDEIAARLRKDSFDQAGTLKRNGKFAGVYLFDWEAP